MELKKGVVVEVDKETLKEGGLPTITKDWDKIGELYVRALTEEQGGKVVIELKIRKSED